MNRFRACLSGSTLLVVFFLTAGVQPAIAQQDGAPHVFHRGIPAGDTCASCHKAVYDQWKASPHATNGIECTVCHGEPTSKDFAGMPALSACETCHTDQVAQLKSDPFMKGKTCVSCHQAHIFTVHKSAAPAAKE
ncbi:MAG: hypothetical protein WBC92_01600 [Terracidiphilus sp.]